MADYGSIYAPRSAGWKNGMRARPWVHSLPRLHHPTQSDRQIAVKSGCYTAGVKLSPGVTVWRVEDIRALIEAGNLHQQYLLSLYLLLICIFTSTNIRLG